MSGRREPWWRRVLREATRNPDPRTVRVETAHGSVDGEPVVVLTLRHPNNSAVALMSPEGARNAAHRLLREADAAQAAGQVL